MYLLHQAGTVCQSTRQFKNSCSLASQTIPQPTVIWVDGGPNDCRLGNGLACETKTRVDHGPFVHTCMFSLKGEGCYDVTLIRDIFLLALLLLLFL